MNQQQEPISILENFEIRKKIALEIKDLINERMRNIREGGYVFKEEHLLTEEDVINHLNNQDVIDKFKLATQVKVNHDNKQKAADLASDYNDMYNKKKLQSRIAVYFHNPENTDEAKIENIKRASISTEKEKMENFSLDVIDYFHAMDPNLIVTDDYPYLAQEALKDPLKTRIGWNFGKIYDHILASNPFLYKALSNIQSAYEIGLETTYTDTYSSQLMLFVPIKDNFPPELLNNIATPKLSESIIKVIDEYAPNTKELRRLDPKDNIDIKSLSSYFPSNHNINENKVNLKLTKALLDKGLLDKDFPFTKCFKYKDKIISFKELESMSVDKEGLPEGVTIENLPEIFVERMNICNEKIRLCAQIKNVKEQYEKLKNDPLAENENELKKDLEEFLNNNTILEDKLEFMDDNSIADELINEPGLKDLTKEERKALYIAKQYKEFKEKNSLLFDKCINGLSEFEAKNKEVLNQRLLDEVHKTEHYVSVDKQAKKALEEETLNGYQQYYNNKVKSFKKKSFGFMANSLSRIYNDINYTEEERKAAFPEALNELNVSKMKDTDLVKDINQKYAKPLKAEQVKEAITCLSQIEEYEYKYNGFWSIRKRWNRSKYQLMMANARNLCAFLTKNGCAICRDHSIKVADAIDFADIVSHFEGGCDDTLNGKLRFKANKALKNYKKNERTIDMYQKKIDEFNALKQPKEEKINEIKEEFLKTYAPAKDYIEKGEIGEYAKNEALYMDDFKEWLNNNEQSKEVYDQQIKEMNDIDLQKAPYVEKQNQCIEDQKNGKLFNPYSKENSLTNNLKVSTNSLVNEVSKEKKNELGKELNTEIKKQ